MIGAYSVDGGCPSFSVNEARVSFYKNKLLQNLDNDVIRRLSLKPVNLELGHELEFPGSPIDHLFFIEDGIGSMTTTFRDGSQVEVGLFGDESVIGVSALMGTKHSLNRVYVQLAGRGYSSPTEAARREFALNGRFQFLALRYVQAQLTQATQTAGCNARHRVDQRLARWLLLCADRARSENFSMSHELLAAMLGSTRPTVSLIAGELRDKGLIDYTRGKITIKDSEGLEKVACECYRVVKDHLDSYTEYDSGFAVTQRQLA